MSEDEAIHWFTKNKKYLPMLPDGGFDFECLCGELLVEGVDYEVVKRYYDFLPPQLKRECSQQL